MTPWSGYRYSNYWGFTLRQSDTGWWVVTDPAGGYVTALPTWRKGAALLLELRP